MKTYKVMNVSDLTLTIDNDINSAFPSQDGLYSIMVPITIYRNDCSSGEYKLIFDKEIIKKVYKILKNSYNDIWMTRIDRGDILKGSIVSKKNYILELSMEIEDFKVINREDKLNELLGID